MSTYGSVPGVLAYVRHIRPDAPNKPTTADIEAWLAGRSAQLTAWLAAAGYAVPVTADVSAEAKALLDRYANVGSAGDVELSMRSSGYDGDSEHDTREARFLSEFARAEAFIAGVAFAALGVPRAEGKTLSGSFSVLLDRR